MEYRVPAVSIAFMAVAALMGIAIPLILFLVFRKKYRADRSPFWIGAAVFALFALALEGLVNSLILGSALGRAIQSNIWLLGAFGGLMAGLFEETGRYAAFRTVLRKRRENDHNALMYGAGHGGFEAFFILFVSMALNIVFSLMFNAWKGDQLTTEGMDGLISMQGMALAYTPPYLFLMSVVERFGAVAIHLSCSVLVWIAAKDGKRFLFYPLAVLVHALVNTMAVILARHVSNLWIVEAAIYVYAAGAVALARWAWRRYLTAGER